jgi:hypothetical protein
MKAPKRYFKLSAIFIIFLIVAGAQLKSFFETKAPDSEAVTLSQSGAASAIDSQKSLIPPKPQTEQRHTVTSNTISSLGRDFEELIATHNPNDAFKAYNLAMGCVWAMQSEKSAELQAPGERSAETVAALKEGSFAVKTAKACGDLTLAQLDRRLKLLEDAAKAGVPMAALRMAGEGPWGDPQALVDRPNDPAVLEWRERVTDLIILAARKGDPSSMTSLSNMYSSGVGVIGKSDQVKALEWNVALWELNKQTTGRVSPSAEQSFQRLSAGLSQKQIMEATQIGQQIAMSATSEGLK